MTAIVGKGTDGVYREVATDTSGNMLVNVAVGGGGGTTLSDILLTDATGALFIARDSGTAVTYYNLGTLSAYTPSGTIAVAAPLAAPVTGQAPIVTTGTAVGLPAAVLKNGAVIKAALTNVAPIFVGPAGVNTTNTGAGTGYPLTPGEAIGIAAANLSSIFINGTAGDFVQYVGN